MPAATLSDHPGIDVAESSRQSGGMRLLAIDTALPAVSACLFDSVLGVLAQERIEMQRGHAEALLPLISRVMSHVSGGFGQLDRIAVTVGPGSFTGIRVGLSAARAFGLACGVPVVGVSTLAAFAAPLIMAGGRDTIIAAIDAHHGQVYAQSFAANGAVLVPPQVMLIEQTIETFGRGPFLMVGNGAPPMAIGAWSRAIRADVAGETVAPDISYVARLGLLADPATALPRPLYLKAPDVKMPEPRPVV
jgi:tRNA threonylcarbamoyl adenosine modification protein YeaZ